MVRSNYCPALVLATVIGLALFLPSAHAQTTPWETYTEAGVEAYQQERYADAERIFRAAVKEAETVGGPHSGLAESLNNLASACRAQGRHAEAEPIYGRYLRTVEKAASPEYPLSPTILEHYAGLLRETGQEGKARELEERAEATRAERNPGATVGHRSIGPVGVAWYRFEADYNSIRNDTVWPRVPCPAGTKAAHVGGYGKIRWCDFSEDGSSWMRSAMAVTFTLAERRPVGPGTGEVWIRHWLYEEQPRIDGLAFDQRRPYVFCFDRKPIADGQASTGEPLCQLWRELPHLIGIIAIVPTFDFTQHPKSDVLHLTTESLRSFRKERAVYRKSPDDEEYAQELALVRLDDGRFRLQTSRGRSVSAPPELVQKVLYALNTCPWQRQAEAHVTDPSVTKITTSYEDEAGQVHRRTTWVQRPVTRTFLGYVDDAGRLRTATIGYDWGLYMTDSQGDHYKTSYPLLLFEVLDEARQLCHNAP